MTAPVDLFGRPARDRRSVRQLPLPLGWRAEGADPARFLISTSNAALVEALAKTETWAAPLAVLTGPPRSGKSLLADHVLSLRPNLQIADPAMAMDETALFHLCTAAMSDRTPLLIVAEAGWRPTLPDLATRVAAAQDFVVPDPDIELVAALLERRLAENHLHLSIEGAAYLAQRIERSFATIDAVTSELAAAALNDGRALSVPFMRQILQLSRLLHQADDNGSAAA
jgi:hypothetical protein